jgi:hypothetical protein
MREVEALKAERQERREGKRARKDARREKKDGRREKKLRRDDPGRSSSDDERRRDSPARRRSRSSRSPARSRSRSRGLGSVRDAKLQRHPAADGACAQGAEVAFGLTYASAQAEVAARANAAQQRPAYAPARAAPIAEPPRSWTKGSNSLRHAPGKLSDAERAARLASMSADAEAHEGERWQRMRRDAQREAADGGDAAAPSHHHAVKPAFLGEQERALFGAESAMNLAERVGALKHYRERTAP